MKRFLTAGLVLASLVLALALAQGMRGPGMMGGMMPMQEHQHEDEHMQHMMNPCANMMGMMMGPGMGQGMMQPGTTTRNSPADAEALARAFLAGHSPEAEVVEVEAPSAYYFVRFQDGDAQGTLRVDATTGEVQLVEHPNGQ